MREAVTAYEGWFKRVVALSQLRRNLKRQSPLQPWLRREAIEMRDEIHQTALIGIIPSIPLPLAYREK